MQGQNDVERQVEELLESFFAAELPQRLPPLPSRRRRWKLWGTLAAAAAAAAAALWALQPSPTPPPAQPAPEPAPAPVTVVVFDEPSMPEVEQVQLPDGRTLVIRTQTGWRHLFLHDRESDVAAWYAFPTFGIEGTLASNGASNP